jgi:hypothetical protein
MSTAASVSNSMTGSGQAASGGAGLPTSSADGTTNDRGGQVVEITTQQQLGTELAQSRGSNWAVGPKGPAAVPIRRSIQVIVRDDRIAILPELESSANPLFRGREVQLDDSMANHVDEIVTVIQQHVADWGMAGHGLYWRPVLVLRVAPGGQPRAEELSRCLKDSGIEIRSAAAAQHGRAAR